MKDTLLKVAHEIAQDLHKAGAIPQETMHQFDARCLAPVKNYTPLQIRRIRGRNKVSQAVFAAYLNTSISTVQQWEQGLKKPAGISLKLLSLVDHHGLAYIAA